MNIILFLLIIISITLSILSLSKKNKNEQLTNLLNYELCLNGGWKGFFNSKNDCIRQMQILNNNLNYQGQGQPANRGIRNTGSADYGAFGDSQIIN
tara:strand:- start:176 stop:463 length:288 start_codon:yes stop_codon:yes gene_type:complete